jgi:hypothetical protein
VILTSHYLARVVDVSLVGDVLIGNILVNRKIGSGYDMFVVGMIKKPSVGAMVHIIHDSNLVKGPNVIVLIFILFLLLFVFYLWVFLMVLNFLVIYVIVPQRSRKSEIKNRLILYFEEKRS